MNDDLYITNLFDRSEKEYSRGMVHTPKEEDDHGFTYQLNMRAHMLDEKQAVMSTHE